MSDPAPATTLVQAWTAARDRLRAAGFSAQTTPLEEGVRRYVRDYLMAEDPHR